MFAIRSVSPLALREKPEPICLLGEIKTPFSRYERVGGRVLIAFGDWAYCSAERVISLPPVFSTPGQKATRSQAPPLVAQTSRVDQRSRPAEIFAWFASPRKHCIVRLRFWENEDRYHPCLDTCFCGGHPAAYAGESSDCVSKAGHCPGASEHWLPAIHKDLGTTETETLSYFPATSPEYTTVKRRGAFSE